MAWAAAPVVLLRLAARVRERPDSVCQAALETRNEGETLSLRQLGCALAPRTHVDFT